MMTRLQFFIFIVTVIYRVVNADSSEIGCRSTNGVVETCYYLNDVPMSWDAANTSCHGMNGSLAVIKTEETQQFINDHIGSPSETWVGAHAVMLDTWRWPDSTEIDDNPRWAQGHPKDDKHVLMSKTNSFYWTDYPNIGINSFICEVLDATGGCTADPADPYITTEVNGQCFHAYKGGASLSWFDARHHCQTTYSQGVLAKINASVFDEIQSFLSSNVDQFDPALTGLWIGLRFEDWIWTPDESWLSYHYWDANFPTSSGGCAHLAVICGDNCPDLVWRNDNCNELKQSLCEVVVPVDSTTTTTNMGKLTTYGQDPPQTTTRRVPEMTMPEMTMPTISPVNVIFEAKLGGNFGPLSGENTIPFDEVEVNIKDGYNPETYTFMAPASGVYLFTLTLASSGLIAQIRVNGVTKGHIENDLIDRYHTQTATVIVTLSEGDIVQAVLHDGFMIQCGATVIASGACKMSGHSLVIF